MRGLLGLSVLVLVAGCTAGDSGGSAEPSDDIVGLLVEPQEIEIDLATSVQFRATAVTELGRVVSVENVAWAIGPSPEEGNRFSGGGSGTISSSGLYVPAGFGDLSIIATANGLSGSAYVRLVPSGTVEVQVFYEVQTGDPPPDAEVRLVGSTAGVVVAAYAWTTLAGDFSGPVDITASAPGHWPLTVYGVKNRSVSLVLRRRTPLADPETHIGEFDFSKVYEDGDDAVRIGLAGSSITRDVIARTFEGLLGPMREVTINGATIDVPENIVIDGAVDTYVTDLELGTVFGLGAEVPAQTFADAITGASDFSEALAELLPEFDSSASSKVYPDGSLVLRHSSESASIAVPARPAITTSHLLAGVDLGPDIDTPPGAGVVPVALAAVEGQAATTALLAVPPLNKAFEDKSYTFLVTSQIGDDQRCSALARRLRAIDDVVLPEFLLPPAPASFTGTGGTLAFAYAATPGADFVYHRFSREVPGTGKLEWDVITPGDSTGFVLPMLLTTNAAQAGATWTVRAGSMEARTYDSSYFYQAYELPEDTNRLVLTNATVD